MERTDISIRSSPFTRGGVLGVFTVSAFWLGCGRVVVGLGGLLIFFRKPILLYSFTRSSRPDKVWSRLFCIVLLKFKLSGMPLTSPGKSGWSIGPAFQL